MRTSYVLTYVAVMAAVFSPVAPQQFVTRTDLVRIDVLASSRDGKPIAGLTAEDFVVTDNGVLQKVDRVIGGDTPVEAWLILDRSGSVRARSAELEVAVRTFVAQLDAADRASIITFRHGLRLFSRVDIGGAAVDAALAEASEGYSSLRDALALALTLRDAHFARSVLLVLSDGVDTMSWLTEAQLKERIARTDLAVHALLNRAGGAREGARYLTALAEQTGGRVVRITDPSQLAPAFLSVLAEARARYVVTYYPRGVSRSGWHEIKVRLRNRAGSVRARQGYMADAAD